MTTYSAGYDYMNTETPKPPKAEVYYDYVPYEVISPSVYPQNISFRDNDYDFGIELRPISERDAFIETLAHIANCAICLKNITVMSALSRYRKMTNHTATYDPQPTIDNLMAEMPWICQTAHNDVIYNRAPKPNLIKVNDLVNKFPHLSVIKAQSIESSYNPMYVRYLA